MNLRHHLEPKKPDIVSMQYDFCEVEEWEKMLCGDRNRNSRSLQWDKGYYLGQDMRELSGMLERFYVLVWMVVPRYRQKKKFRNNGLILRLEFPMSELQNNIFRCMCGVVLVPDCYI